MRTEQDELNDPENWVSIDDAVGIILRTAMSDEEGRERILDTFDVFTRSQRGNIEEALKLFSESRASDSVFNVCEITTSGLRKFTNDIERKSRRLREFGDVYDKATVSAAVDELLALVESTAVMTNTTAFILSLVSMLASGANKLEQGGIVAPQERKDR